MGEGLAGGFWEMRVLLYSLSGTLLGIVLGINAYWHDLQAMKNSWCGGYVMLSLEQSLIVYGVVGLIGGLVFAALVKRFSRKTLHTSSNVSQSNQ